MGAFIEWLRGLFPTSPDAPQDDDDDDEEDDDDDEEAHP